MNIDPRNPLLRYVDKVILALAVLAAISALLKLTHGPSPAGLAVRELNRAMESLEQAASRQQPRTYAESNAYERLADRFHSSTIARAVPFRDYVFSRPDEVIGPAVVLEYREDIEPEHREATIVRIAESDARLRNQDYDRARVLPIIGDRGIAKVEMDKKKKQLELTPIEAGEGRVRVEFPTGASYEFHLAVQKLEVPKSPEPRAPVMVKAEAHRGYVTLTWQTNEKSCPAESYKIYRSELPDGEKVVIHEYDVKGLEAPAPEDAGLEFPPPTVRSYWWDDHSVSPGASYVYEIETMGFVTEAETTSLEVSPRRAETEPVVALNPMIIRLVGGYGDVANFEVEVWSNYLPRFPQVRAWVCQKVASRDVDTGYLLVDVEERMLEAEGSPGRLMLSRRAILFDARTGPVELLKQRPRKREYEKEVKNLFRELDKSAAPLPMLKEKKLSGGKIELTLVNTTQDTVKFAFLGREKYRGELRSGEVRTIDLTGRDFSFDLAVGFPDGSALAGRKLKATSGKGYELKIEPPQAQAPEAEENEAGEPGLE